MRFNYKYILKETGLLLITVFLGLIFFTIPYVYFTNYFNPRGLSFIFQFLFASGDALMKILDETYGLLLLLPYLLFVIIRFISGKKLKINLIITTFISIGLYFIIIPILFSCMLDINMGYYKTKYQVCFGEQTGVYDGGSFDSNHVKDVDKGTFHVFPEAPEYARDKNKVYYAYQKTPCFFDCIPKYYDVDKGIKDADAASFEMLNYGWAKDKYRIYKDGFEVLDADINTFIPLNYDYAKDEKFVYKREYNFEVVKIHDADPETFSIIKDTFSKDKNYVFNGVEIFEYADPVTFEVLEYDNFKDKKNFYSCYKYQDTSDFYPKYKCELQ